MPQVLGVFYQTGSNADQRQQAIRAHALFLDEYSDSYPQLEAFPLLVYDSGKDRSGGTPSFRLAPTEQPCAALPLLPGQTHARCKPGT